MKTERGRVDDGRERDVVATIRAAWKVLKAGLANQSYVVVVLEEPNNPEGRVRVGGAGAIKGIRNLSDQQIHFAISSFFKNCMEELWAYCSDVPVKKN
jgi:hypothetical protein